MYPEDKHILVIDNDDIRRAVSKAVLTDEGFTVTAVPEGFSAIRAAEADHFALAIAAVGLPGMLDGTATVRQIRARQPWLKALFTGAVTARPQTTDEYRDDFIPTPFDRRELLGCVFELLQRSTGGAARPAGRSRAG